MSSLDAFASSLRCSPRGRMFCLLLVIASSLSLPAVRAESIRQTRFVGALNEAGSGDDAIIRRFEALLHTAPSGDFFCVFDDARTGCPWPESFGDLAAAGDVRGLVPHLLYEYDGAPTTIPLPPLKLQLPTDIAVDAAWESGPWRCRAVAETDVDGLRCWAVEAQESRGRRLQLLIEKLTGVLVRAELDVFMGRGDRFRLTLQRTESDVIDDPAAESVRRVQLQLRDVQRAVDRRTDSERHELTARQVAVVESLLPTLVTTAATGPFAEVVQRIQTDITRQRGRLNAGAMQAEKLVGENGPEYALTLVSGKTLDSETTSGQTVVLHFWDYRDQPLSEPYGQTGYLEFLHNQLRSDAIRFIGVSTNPDFQTSETVARGRRSARKLIEFMNLSYDVGYDDGALLRSIGDPRPDGGQLPLWLVVAPDGRIVHYASGYYEIDDREGLKELRDIVQQQSR